MLTFNIAPLEVVEIDGDYWRDPVIPVNQCEYCAVRTVTHILIVIDCALHEIAYNLIARR